MWYVWISVANRNQTTAMFLFVFFIIHHGMDWSTIRTFLALMYVDRNVTKIGFKCKTH